MWDAVLKSSEKQQVLKNISRQVLSRQGQQYLQGGRGRGALRTFLHRLDNPTPPTERFLQKLFVLFLGLEAGLVFLPPIYDYGMDQIMDQDSRRAFLSAPGKLYHAFWQILEERIKCGVKVERDIVAAAVCVGRNVKAWVLELGRNQVELLEKKVEVMWCGMLERKAKEERERERKAREQKLRELERRRREVERRRELERRKGDGGDGKEGW
jgi:hypothetical protein